jgi:hypothetical protein
MELSELVEKEKRSSEKRLKGREKSAYDNLDYLYKE